MTTLLTVTYSFGSLYKLSLIHSLSLSLSLTLSLSLFLSLTLTHSLSLSLKASSNWQVQRVWITFTNAYIEKHSIKFYITPPQLYMFIATQHRLLGTQTWVRETQQNIVNYHYWEGNHMSLWFVSMTRNFPTEVTLAYTHVCVPLCNVYQQLWLSWTVLRDNVLVLLWM